MNGPGPIPPPPRSPGMRGAVVLMRVVLTVIPLVTIGMLGWVPLVWLAIAHRRARDWVVLGLTAFLCTGALILTGIGSDDSWQSDTGVAALLMLAVFCSLYFVYNDLRRGAVLRQQHPHHQPYPSPYPLPAPMPMPMHGPAPSPAPGGGRIDQVRAELDELSAYLREQEGR